MLTKTKNIPLFFSKNQKTSECMVQKKRQPKFERNPCIRFRDNCDTYDGRQTNFDFMNSADSQAELNMVLPQKL